MKNTSEQRADKFLWSVRIYKTRSLAAEACKKGRVFVNGIAIKASKTIKTNDNLEIKKPPVTFSYHVISIPKSRVSAKLVIEFLKDTTTKEELEKMTSNNSFFINRERGSGRPTKKERRVMDKIRNN